MLEKRLDELKDFLNNVSDKLTKERLWNWQLLNKEKELFVRDLILQYNYCINSFLASQELYSSDDLYFKDFMEKFRKYSSPDKPENEDIVDSLVDDFFGAVDGVPVHVFTSFFSGPKYRPPSSPFEILWHLVALYAFYRYVVDYVSLKTLLHVDLVMAKLAVEVANMFSTIADVGKDADRTKQSTVARRLRTNRRRQNAVTAFYLIDADGMSFHRIAKTIEKRLIEKGIFAKPKPGEKPKDRTKSIKRDLLSDDKVRNNLEKMGVFKDKRNA